MFKLQSFLAFMALVTVAPSAHATQSPAPVPAPAAAGASSASKAMTINPQIGFGSFTLKGSDISGSRAGSVAGATVFVPANVVGLDYEVGLTYTEAGAKDDAILASVEYSLGYLLAPIGARYRFMGAQALENHAYARGGVGLGYLMIAKQKAQVFGMEAEGDIKGNTNSFDVMPYVGTGYAWSMSDGQMLNIDFNYTRGLTNVLKNQESKNIGWILTGGYSFVF